MINGISTVTIKLIDKITMYVVSLFAAMDAGGTKEIHKAKTDVTKPISATITLTILPPGI